jgi:hypothetical protein
LVLALPQLALALSQLALALSQLALALSQLAMGLRQQLCPSYKYAPGQMATGLSVAPFLWLLLKRADVWHKYQFYDAAQSCLYPRCSGLI